MKSSNIEATCTQILVNESQTFDMSENLETTNSEFSILPDSEITGWTNLKYLYNQRPKTQKCNKSNRLSTTSARYSKRTQGSKKPQNFSIEPLSYIKNQLSLGSKVHKSQNYSERAKKPDLGFRRVSEQSYELLSLPRHSKNPIKSLDYKRVNKENSARPETVLCEENSVNKVQSIFPNDCNHVFRNSRKGSIICKLITPKPRPNVVKVDSLVSYRSKPKTSLKTYSVVKKTQTNSVPKTRAPSKYAPFTAKFRSFGRNYANLSSLN